MVRATSRRPTLTTNDSFRGVEVLDLGLNNLASLMRALALAGFDHIRSIEDCSLHRPARLMVLPGVGAFGAAMGRIHDRGFDTVVRDHVSAGGKLMGVCLGMHLLGSSSEESPGVSGLNLIPGEVVQLPPEKNERIPHVGWNSVHMTDHRAEFSELEEPFDFYFIHSYVLQPASTSHVLGSSPYGETSFTSAVLSGPILAFQFHPEKSSQPGHRLLKQARSWSHA